MENTWHGMCVDKQSKIIAITIPIFMNNSNSLAFRGSGTRKHNPLDIIVVSRGFWVDSPRMFHRYEASGNVLGNRAFRYSRI